MTVPAAKRKHISLLTKLASTLLELHPTDREHAKLITAAEYVARFEFDHAELWALTQNDHFTNLTPRLIAPHREKSRGDTSAVAKVKRIERRELLHKEFMADMERHRRDRESDRRYLANKRKIPSRPFPQRRKENGRAR